MLRVSCGDFRGREKGDREMEGIRKSGRMGRNGKEDKMGQAKKGKQGGWGKEEKKKLTSKELPPAPCTSPPIHSRRKTHIFLAKLCNNGKTKSLWLLSDVTMLFLKP